MILFLRQDLLYWHMMLVLFGIQVNIGYRRLKLEI
ncbi:hypothetical protein M086_4601, partial [Bacteroides fragilis str. S13 L11]